MAVLPWTLFALADSLHLWAKRRALCAAVDVGAIVFAVDPVACAHATAACRWTPSAHVRLPQIDTARHRVWWAAPQPGGGGGWDDRSVPQGEMHFTMACFLSSNWHVLVVVGALWCHLPLVMGCCC